MMQHVSGSARRIADAGLAAALELYGVTAADIDRRHKGEPATGVYQALLYILREDYRLTYSDIGNLFSGRDHSTIHHNVRRAAVRMRSDPELRATVQTLQAAIKVGLASSTIPTAAQVQQQQTLQMLDTAIAVGEQLQQLARDMGDVAASMTRAARLQHAAITAYWSPVVDRAGHVA